MLLMLPRRLLAFLTAKEKAVVAAYEYNLCVISALVSRHLVE